ncbi:MAG: chemotaxis protein CheW [Hydrogenophilus thermoluteolus]|nr:chemotaxis protein CheW [Hydrogenophilus thermoluteolus]MBW7656285.1 chemotaxis protein CheW [Hydrogenophilus thermoluteolus]
MAKRTDIRRFQETLAQKLAAAQHQSEGIAARWLGVMVGAQPVLLPLSATAGVIHEFTLTSTPFSPPHLRGLTNVRGELHDVIDFAPLMAIPETPIGATTRLVVLQPAIAPRTALLVARVVGLRRPEGMHPLAPETPMEGVVASWQDGAEPNAPAWHEIDLPFWLHQAAQAFTTEPLHE